MVTITIPKELVRRGDLALVPLDEYEAFLNWRKIVRAHKEFTPTVAERSAVRRARKNFAAGNYLTLDELRKDIGLKN